MPLMAPVGPKPVVAGVGSMLLGAPLGSMPVVAGIGSMQVVAARLRIAERTRAPPSSSNRGCLGGQDRARSHREILVIRARLRNRREARIHS